MLGRTLRWDGLRRGLLRDAAAASPFSLNLPHEPAPFEAVVVAWVAAIELALVRGRVKVRVRVRVRLRLRLRLRPRLRLRLRLRLRNRVSGHLQA